MDDAVFLVHLVATWYLVGLCWLVQRVQYPLMSRVGGESYAGYEQSHIERIGPVVAPMMLIELVSGVWILIAEDAPMIRLLLLFGLALIVVIWLSTFLLQVPLHRKLSRGFDEVAHRRLVETNWIRTTAWTIRGALLLLVFWKLFGRSQL